MPPLFALLSTMGAAHKGHNNRSATGGGADAGTPVSVGGGVWPAVDDADGSSALLLPLLLLARLSALGSGVAGRPVSKRCSSPLPVHTRSRRTKVMTRNSSARSRDNSVNVSRHASWTETGGIEVRPAGSAQPRSLCKDPSSMPWAWMQARRKRASPFESRRTLRASRKRRCSARKRLRNALNRLRSVRRESKGAPLGIGPLKGWSHTGDT